MRVVSGIQPTGGQYHIGNYLGAVKHWAAMQQENECLFFIADLHALTVPQEPETLRKAILEKTIELLALGIDPERCVLFVQSHVKEHAELAWLFTTIAPLGELERMTQYKDKARKQKKEVYAGLLTYPVLMAADILMYKPDAVPVGEDQKQHLEFTRLIARKFNARFGETFPEPKALIPKEGARIMSLQEPKKKMSKSDPLDTQILLFDDPAVIRQKIMKAVTDTGKEVRYDAAKKPGISNLLVIYSLFSEMSVKETERRFKGKGYGSFKKSLAELLIESLEPFRQRRRLLESREVYVQELLSRGAAKASSIASSTMEETRAKIGLSTPN